MATVLIVEDEPDILLLHRIVLEGAGHRVLLAADGRQALERIESDRPDAVVLDVMMPVLDGWGVLEQLADMPQAPPVLVVSALAESALAARAKSAGARDYLRKPFDNADLIAAVDSLLN